MHEDSYIWAWVGGVAVVIALILGAWWWSVRNTPVVNPVAYDTSSSTNEALQSPNAPTPTAPVVIVPTPTKSSSKVDTSVLGVIAGIPNTSRFSRLLTNSGISAQLRGKGPYTVFVPTNQSFMLLPPGALNLTASELRRLVGYHIVSGKAIDVNALVAGVVEASSKDMLNISVLPSDRSARINSSVAIRAYKASNGIVYVVSEVLLPPLTQ